MNASKKLTTSGLPARQELFCKLYTSFEEHFANGTESYIKAYGLDPQKPTTYRTAQSNASKLLTNTKVLERINELLDLTGLNDEFVDKQLLFVITQNADFSSKTAAIREYNKLKKRITDKLEVHGKLSITEFLTQDDTTAVSGKDSA